MCVYKNEQKKSEKLFMLCQCTELRIVYNRKSLWAGASLCKSSYKASSSWIILYSSVR